MRLSMFLRKNFLILVPVFALLLITFAACASAPAATLPSPAPSTSAPASSSAPTPVAPAPAYTINIANKADLGDYLVDSNGMTLYYFKNDTSGKSRTTAVVLQLWPIFYADSIRVPSSLNAADFGTINRADGKKQTTYKGWPLYYLSKDRSAGETLGQGSTNVWFVVGPSIQPAPASSNPAPTTP